MKAQAKEIIANYPLLCTPHSPNGKLMKNLKMKKNNKFLLCFALVSPKVTETKKEINFLSTKGKKEELFKHVQRVREISLWVNINLAAEVR